jgi:ribose transport system substrate-binding protein
MIRRVRWTRRAATRICGVALCVLGLVACGSSSNSSSTGSSASGQKGADVVAAQKVMSPYLGHPSPFPVDTPLKKSMAADTKMVYMQCASPVCQILWPFYSAAGKAMGVTMTRVLAGSQAQQVANAFDTAVAEKPNAVLVPAIDPSLFRTQLAQLQKEGVTVATSGAIDPQKYGVKVFNVARTTIETAGDLLGAQAIVAKGGKANVVFYGVRELSFVPALQGAFERTITELCPSCKVRYVNIPLATVGSSAPSRMVSDLQRNPDTNVAVFSTDEMAVGLPATLKAAGITGLYDYGFGPTPANLQYIKDGQESGALGLDLPVNAWSLVDSAARSIQGVPLSKAEATGDPPVPDMQFLTKKDITFDPTKGWSGYPDYAQRFGKLWSPNK